MEMQTKLGKFSPEDVERATGLKVASLEGVWAVDMLERPVLVRASGVEATVEAQGHGESMVIIQAWRNCPEVVGRSGERDFFGQVGEPVEVDLAELIPLCVDCWEPLVESEFMGPGECRNHACFLCQDGETF